MIDRLREGFVGCLFAAAAASLNLAQAGPLSTLYLSTGSTIEVMVGNAVVNTWTTGDQEFSLAVDTTVKTWSQGNPQISLFGKEYSLGGVATGTTYLNQVGCCFRDGTTDGTYNYAVRQGLPGVSGIYRFDLDWTNPVRMPLSSLGLDGAITGIAYDPTDDTFWVAGGGSNGFIVHVDRKGDFISFIAAPPGDTPSLAYDRADDTLWYFSKRVGGLSELVQYPARDTSGPVDPLSRISHPVHVYSMDFALQRTPTAVPEPGTAALVGLGVVALAGLRRARPTFAAAHVSCVGALLHRLGRVGRVHD